MLLLGENRSEKSESTSAMGILLPRAQMPHPVAVEEHLIIHVHITVQEHAPQREVHHRVPPMCDPVHRDLTAEDLAENGGEGLVADAWRLEVVGKPHLVACLVQDTHRERRDGGAERVARNEQRARRVVACRPAPFRQATEVLERQEQTRQDALQDGQEAGLDAATFAPREPQWARPDLHIPKPVRHSDGAPEGEHASAAVVQARHGPAVAHFRNTGGVDKSGLRLEKLGMLHEANRAKHHLKADVVAWLASPTQ
mmetsp:Transcript_66924/g.131758  ORF Transcript_66924/g.131758 Transcript_66924/m.131758 type:complete len:255 (-) Transcript_66924:40-804(-)